LPGRAAGQVVFEDDAYFLGHLHLLAVNGACTVPWPACCDREQRRGSGAGAAGCSPGQTSISDGQPCSYSYAQLLVLMGACDQVTADLRWNGCQMSWQG
jgi:hypothetical protein